MTSNVYYQMDIDYPHMEKLEVLEFSMIFECFKFLIYYFCLL